MGLLNVFGRPLKMSLSADSGNDDHPNVQKLSMEVENLNEQIEKSRTHEQSLGEAKDLAEKKAARYFRALERVEKQLRASEKAHLFASEQVRRLSELLQNVEETAATVRKENNILTSNIATLQTGVQKLTDEDVKKEMTVLYHDLEQWILNYIRGLFDAQPGLGSLNAEDSLIAQMQSEISCLIHQHFWTSDFVGCGAQNNQYMTEINDFIGHKCPSHVLQHWRFAMSTGTLELGRLRLMSECDFIIQQFGNNNGLPITESSRLKQILWRCIELKTKLEYQDAKYIFWYYVADSPFRSERMRNPMKEDATGEVIEYTVWPGIYKESKDGHLIVEKAVVRTVPLRI
ncbi:hypothetical protein N7452_006677 [Penicillium brevicompactum]|uniref:Uncharacterized protein n=1 Tax=Penicillium brevicompactum TaxID=5074 RepID=A0A9W9UGW2_PENBR|nr:hypothetical protein N7452_006677 [Penicillium brevicompactum]